MRIPGDLHEGFLQQLGTRLRNVRRRGEGQRHEERQFGKFEKSPVIRVTHQLPRSRHVVKGCETFAPAELHERPQRASFPQIGPASQDAAQVGELAIDFAAFHAQPDVARARKSAHDVNLQSQEIARDQGKRRVG